ncbi:adenosine deaminase [Bombardia bombarda]|uniref:Adenine deaminase n=1 Tax=Bombardia bombarda TaxID=252184 RepID=A0AA39XJM9_9PEZI|nr:adenosine deaminase [Bombardia bombarda]
MCKSPLHPFLVALPKCEHHMHLEGSLSPELLFALAKKNNISLPSPFPTVSRSGPGTAEEQDEIDPAFASPATLRARYAAFTSLDDFLHYYYIGMRVLLTADDFEELAYAYLARASLEGNVRHAEVFFDPQAHVSRGVTVAVIVEGWERAVERVEGEFGGGKGRKITALLVPCLLRHLEVEDSRGLFAGLLAEGYFHGEDGGEEGPKLAGVGLCSTEMDRPPGLWKEIFEMAREAGVRRTAHAGEEGPAGYVSAALDELWVERIDHGVRAAEDGELMGRLAREGVMLTVCPVSNVRLKGVERLEDVPIREFLDKGVRFSLNSDDPAYFGAYLQEVYCAVEEAFGLSVGEWAMIARNAVEGSWCGEERKREILGEVEEVVEGWERQEEEVLN